MESIIKSWQGSERLWRVFWVYGVIVSLAFAMLGAIIISKHIRSLLIPMAILYNAYLIWFYVSAWRCAFNCDRAIWGYFTRVLVVLSAVTYIGQAFAKI